MVDLVTDHPCCDNPHCECMGETWEDHVDTLTIERDRFKGQREAMHRRAQKAEGEAARLRVQLAEARAALEPFAFMDFRDTQAAWEAIFRDQFRDWIGYDDMDAARAAIRALKGGAQ